MDPSDSYKAGKESGRNEVVELLIRKDERIQKLEAENKKLRDALIAARDHLDWIGYGDEWERGCAVAVKLPKIIDQALNETL